MPLEVEFIGLTGPVSTAAMGFAKIKIFPTTGPQSGYDIAVDPVGGPAQEYGRDFTVTGLVGGITGAVIYYGMSGSDIRGVQNTKFNRGETGVQLRAVYNH